MILNCGKKIPENFRFFKTFQFLGSTIFTFHVIKQLNFNLEKIYLIIMFTKISLQGPSKNEGSFLAFREEQWPSGKGDVSEPGGPGFDSSIRSRQPQVVAHQHLARRVVSSTPSLLSQLSPLPTSGDDEWAAAKHCGRAKRSRISGTHSHRLRFRYINKLK